MSVIITSPFPGSLKVTTSSASPVNSYYANLQTVSIQGDPFNQSVSILNSNGQSIYQVKVSALASVGASGAGSFTLGNAVDAIASLITH